MKPSSYHYSSTSSLVNAAKIISLLEVTRSDTQVFYHLELRKAIHGKIKAYHIIYIKLSRQINLQHAKELKAASQLQRKQKETHKWT